MYAQFASQVGVLANEINPMPDDEEYKEARFLVVTYLRMAATKLRGLAELRALAEKGL
jgi:hypothetical protein